MTACNPIKILYAISSLANEGPTRVLLNVVRNLDRQQFEPSIVTFISEKDSSLLTEFRALGVPIYPLIDQLQDKPARILGRLRALRQLLLRGNFRIAHAHCPRSLFFLVAATPRSVKSAYTVHCYPDTQFKVIHGPFKGPIITAGANLALRLIDQPIACADSVASEYLQKRGYTFPAVNNGIEPMSLASYGERNSVKKDLGLDPERRYLLFIGRLSAEKRITELVRTFSKIDNPQVDLVVVGVGPEEASLRAFSNAHLHMAGFHSDIRPFLAACDYYISPSATEGLSNSLLEAMSVGMPSLLSDIPSHRSVIQKCSGFVAKMFDPSSPESLVAGIKYLQEQDSEYVRAGIRENFQSLFHAKAMTQGYETLYKEMLA